MSEPAYWNGPVQSPVRPSDLGAPRTGASRPVVDDLRFAAMLAVSLAVLGAGLGLIWSAWSPRGPIALVVSPGVFIPDETESFIAADGRFLVITVVVGVLAGLVGWQRVRSRGPLVLFALGIGGLAASLLTELVGHLTGGGTFDGAPNTIIKALPLSLHTQGLLFVEPAAAALVYGLLVAFAVRDDLGRSDPVRDSLALASVRAGHQAQDGRGHGNAPGALQQGDLPPQ